MRSNAMCQGSAVDAANVNKWLQVIELLSVCVSHNERPRITVYRHDGSEFTFVAPTNHSTSTAISWMYRACQRLRRSEGRIRVPGPTYGGWFTTCIYDEFHERTLPASIEAFAREDDNVVSIGCDGIITVAHRNETCPLPVLNEDIESCDLYARIDEGSVVGGKALCKRLCPVREDLGNNSKILPAMLKGKRAQIRVSAPYGVQRRDFTLSLWGFKNAHDWIVTKCASLPDFG